MIFAIPVPTTPKIRMYITDCCTSATPVISKKPEKNKTANAGNVSTKKFPVEIVKGLKSDMYFLIRLTLVAYPKHAIITRIA